MIACGTGITPKELYANSTRRTVDILEKNGIARDILPVGIGGDYDYYAKVAEWAGMRLSIDSFVNEVPLSISPDASAITANVLTLFERPRDKRAYRLAQRKPQTGQSKEDFLREWNRLYVRRYTQKQKILAAALNEQKKLLEAQREVLQKQNKELESALTEELKIVMSHQVQNRWWKSKRDKNVGNYLPSSILLRIWIWTMTCSLSR